MKHFLLALLAGLLAIEVARGDDSVVLGKGIRNEYVSGLPCPDGSICMDSAYLWTIAAKRTVVGPAVKGRVRVLAAQHMEATSRYVKSVELFIVRPILDPEIVKACGAQYYLLALSPRIQDGTYCIPMHPEKVGIRLQQSEVGIDPDHGYYCFKKNLL